jgi:hypothetical protein
VTGPDPEGGRRPGPLGLETPGQAVRDSERSADRTNPVHDSPDLSKNDSLFHGQAARLLQRLDELSANPAAASKVHAQDKSGAAPDPLHASWSALSGSEPFFSPEPRHPTSASSEQSYSTDASPQGFGDRSSDNSSSLARINELLQQIIGELRNQQRSFLPCSRQLHER